MLVCVVTLATHQEKESKVKRIILDSMKDHFMLHISSKGIGNKMFEGKGCKLIVCILLAMESKGLYVVVSQRLLVDEGCQGIGFNSIFKVSCLRFFEENDVNTFVHAYTLYYTFPLYCYCFDVHNLLYIE